MRGGFAFFWTAVVCRRFCFGFFSHKTERKRRDSAAVQKKAKLMPGAANLVPCRVILRVADLAMRELYQSRAPLCGHDTMFSSLMASKTNLPNGYTPLF
jgi:hypothetical protein